MIPGEYRIATGNIAINAGRETRTIVVENHGDRPIQVGSHYHFYEVNPALRFARESALGFRLNIPAGTAVRLSRGKSERSSWYAWRAHSVFLAFAATSWVRWR